MKKVSYGIFAMAFLALAACGKKQPRPTNSTNPFTGAWLAPMSNCEIQPDGSSKLEVYYIYDDKKIINLNEIYNDANCSSLVDAEENYRGVYSTTSNANEVEYTVYEIKHVITLSADKKQITDSALRMTFTKSK